MASSSRPVITIKQQHQTGDSVITIKQQHQTGDSFITVNQQRQTGDSVITINQQRQTGDSVVITVKQEHETGDTLITMKQQHPIPTDDSFMTVKVKDQAGLVYYFRVRRDEPLHQQLDRRYREVAKMEDYHSFRFLFNMCPIGVDKTANVIGLKDGDRIHVMFYQFGD